MTIKQVYRDDLLNRFSGYTFTETVINSMTLVELKDAGLVVVASDKVLVADDGYVNIRRQMGILENILCELTGAQIALLTGTLSGVQIFNKDTGGTQLYNGSVWIGGAVFTELYDDAGNREVAGWGAITSPTAYLSKLITVIVHNDATNSKDVGIRAVGSSLERKFPMAKDTALSMVVVTDPSGNFEVYSEGSADVHFTVVGVIG